MRYEREVRERLTRCSTEQVLVEGIQSMIDGAIGGLMVNLGHSVQCDPAESIAYGEAAVTIAIRKLKLSGK